MKTTATKHIGLNSLSFLIKYLLIGLLVNFNHSVFCQPIPGDLGLSTTDGGPVGGGGAPLNPALGLIILFSLIYLMVKYISIQKIKDSFFS